MTRVYEEIVDFIAGGSTREDVAAWVPSATAKERVAALLQGERDSSLSPDDKAELNHYMELEHLMRLAKARAGRGRAA